MVLVALMMVDERQEIQQAKAVLLQPTIESKWRCPQGLL